MNENPPTLKPPSAPPPTAPTPSPAPAAAPAAPAAPAPAPAKPSSPPPAWLTATWFVWLSAIVLGVLLFVGIDFLADMLTHESTDDAFIAGHIISVAPRVSGQVV